MLWSLVAISVAFGAFQAVYHSQFVIDQLDAASYMQFASWISQHGSLPIPQNAAAFGHAPGVDLRERRVLPGRQLHRAPVHGRAADAALARLLGGRRQARGVLGAGARRARHLHVRRPGGQAGRPALGAARRAGASAIAIPEAYVSRNTYSETLAQILLLGALSLWIDAQRTDRGEEDAGRWRAQLADTLRGPPRTSSPGVAGLLFGITLLVRIDGPADILFVVPYCGLLILRRQRQVIAAGRSA